MRLINMMAIDAQHGSNQAAGGLNGPSEDMSEISPVLWNKAKQDLLLKHVSFVPTSDRKIQQFRCLSLTPDDVLLWWSTQGIVD